MNIESFVIEKALILIPALYVLGMVLKNATIVNDKYIPPIILFFGIIGAISLMGFTPEAVIQGVLVTGSTVFVNQLIKQSGK
jgi:EamA domain-containing membrane protein RarD